MTDGKLARQLTLRQGIPLAIGSIAGSGILFLPSLTYVVGGHDVLLIWAAATLMCIPMLFMFNDMVRARPDSRGIEGFINDGLGRHVASSVPLLTVALVSIGIPSGALVAGSYVEQATGSPLARVAGAGLVMLTAVAANLAGVRTGARVQTVLTWGLIALVVVLVLLTLPKANHHYGVVRPEFRAFGPVVSGIVLAFWAFAGFENLTFIAGEFKNPGRDFLVAVVTALTIYGTLAVAVTATIAAVIDRADVDQLTGLLQLAGTVPPHWLSTTVVCVLALALMQANATSWVWGVSRLVFAVADARGRPAALARLDRRNLPRNAIALLSTLFTLVTAGFVAFPTAVVPALKAASAVFIVLYVLCIVSYLRSQPITRSSAWKSVLNGFLLLFFLVTLAKTGLPALYPVVVFVLATLASVVGVRRELRRRPQPVPMEHVTAGGTHD